MEACAECGFGYADLASAAVPDALRTLPEELRAALGDASESEVRTRPEAHVWSALEYLCHVRDVLLVQRERIVLAQVLDEPTLAPMSRDARVELCGYDAQDAREVLDQVAMAAQLCALSFERLGPGGWRRVLHYNFPEPALRDVGWVGVHTVHEGVHHLADVRRVLAEVRSGP